MTHVTCRLTAKNRDQLLNPALGYRVWTTFSVQTPDAGRSWRTRTTSTVSWRRRRVYGLARTRAGTTTAATASTGIPVSRSVNSAGSAGRGPVSATSPSPESPSTSSTGTTAVSSLYERDQLLRTSGTPREVKPLSLPKGYIARWRTARVIISLILPNQSQRSNFAVIGYAVAGRRRSPVTCRLL